MRELCNTSHGQVQVCRPTAGDSCDGGISALTASRGIQSQDIYTHLHSLMPLYTVVFILNIPVLCKCCTVWNSFSEIQIARSKSIVRALLIDQHHTEIGQQLARCFVAVRRLNTHITSPMHSHAQLWQQNDRRTKFTGEKPVIILTQYSYMC